MAREGVQARGERGTCGHKPPALIAQADSPPNEILSFGGGEDDPAILGQKENGETGGRDRRAERLCCCSRPGEEVMDRHRALQMRREGFQEMPFRRFHPNRIGRSLEAQISERYRRAKETNGDPTGPSLWPHKFVGKDRGFKCIGLGDLRHTSPGAIVGKAAIAGFNL
jgi:hypothetical protein